ncbi:hypothetical protein ACS0TY_014966 [Phlomoides rotata]
MESHTNNTNNNAAAARDSSARLTSIHVTALDGIVNVNSLFTIAVFIGFSFTTPEDAHTGSRPGCTANRETVRRLIVYEVVSFSFFLYSSLIAQSIKLGINLVNNMDPNDPHKANIHPNILKYGLFGSATGSLIGSLFLVLSIVDFIQVKLGVYSCGGKSVYGIVTLVALVGFALLVYGCTAVYVSFFAAASSKSTAQQSAVSSIELA